MPLSLSSPPDPSPTHSHQEPPPIHLLPNPSALPTAAVSHISQPDRPTVTLWPTGNVTWPSPAGRTHLLQLVILFHVLLGCLTSTLCLLFKGFVGRQQRGLLGDESHQASKQAAIEKEGRAEQKKAGKMAGMNFS